MMRSCKDVMTERCLLPWVTHRWNPVFLRLWLGIVSIKLRRFLLAQRDGFQRVDTGIVNTAVEFAVESPYDQYFGSAGIMHLMAF